MERGTGPANHSVFHRRRLHDPLLSSLEDNRQFSLTVERIGSHETYQFKGEFVRDTQPSDVDLAAHKRIRDRFAKVVSKIFGYPEDLCRAFISSAWSCHLFQCARNLSSDARPWCWPQALSPGGEVTDTVKLPDDIKPVMQNGIPAIVVTCSADGIPNTTIISQVYYVDPTHVALSFQFFNKTIRNVRENPNACVALNDLEAATKWILDVQYDHSETEGDDL